MSRLVLSATRKRDSQADALRNSLRVPLPLGDMAMYEWLCSRVEVAQGTQMWATEWAMGLAMTLEETLDFALARIYESFA